jgi:acyl carrier protein
LTGRIKMNQELKEIFARTLDLDVSQINDDLSPENTASWDSINNLKIISAIEANFSIKFSSQEIQSLITANYKIVEKILSRHIR